MDINFENTIKKLGEINKAIYGINPYEDNRPFDERLKEEINKITND